MSQQGSISRLETCITARACIRQPPRPQQPTAEWQRSPAAQRLMTKRQQRLPQQHGMHAASIWRQRGLHWPWRCGRMTTVDAQRQTDENLLISCT